MASTIILLYALNTAGNIPEGCFIAAWILLAVNIAAEAIKFFCKKENK